LAVEEEERDRGAGHEQGDGDGAGDDEAREQRFVGWAGSAAHEAGFHRLEGERQRESHGGDEVDPQDLHG
jgi:hypothetical protein